MGLPRARGHGGGEGKGGRQGAPERPPAPPAQNSFFKAATQKAFTTVLAGLAFTITTLPKISFLPALVAGLTRVLIMHKPGMVNLPTFLVSLAPKAARAFKTDTTCPFFNSASSASFRAMAPLDIARPVFMPFMALGAMAARDEGCGAVPG